jgi:hypothetical protein
VLFDFKRQKIGFVREFKEVKTELADRCTVLQSSFTMDLQFSGLLLPYYKTNEKSYTNLSKPSGVSIVGVLLKEGSYLFLEADFGKRVAKFIISNTGRLTLNNFINSTEQK